MNALYNYFNYLYPVFALVFLSFVVAGKMFSDRMIEMKNKKLRLSVFKTSKDREALESVQAADNFKNLFEMPVLFYLLIILLFSLNLYRPFYLSLIWVYVFTRYAHSFIHCTYNKVIHRFYAFVAGFFILAILWIGFFVEILLLGNRQI